MRVQQLVINHHLTVDLVDFVFEGLKRVLRQLLLDLKSNVVLNQPPLFTVGSLDSHISLIFLHLLLFIGPEGLRILSVLPEFRGL